MFLLIGLFFCFLVIKYFFNLVLAEKEEKAYYFVKGLYSFCGVLLMGLIFIISMFTVVQYQQRIDINILSIYKDDYNNYNMIYLDENNNLEEKELQFKNIDYHGNYTPKICVKQFEYNKYHNILFFLFNSEKKITSENMGDDFVVYIYEKDYNAFLEDETNLEIFYDYMK